VLIDTNQCCSAVLLFEVNFSKTKRPYAFLMFFEKAQLMEEKAGTNN
jgi:hypothetical protein